MFRVGALLFATVLGHAIAADEPSPPRDPMQPFGAGPAVAAGAAAPSLHLTAVLISPERRIAIVNGIPHRVGEAVAGAEIVRIDAEAIRVRRRGQVIVVPLGRAVVLGSAARPEEEVVP